MEKLSTDQSIGKLLTKKTRKLFESGGYDLQAIEIKHLLSHTSGIQDYADDDYIDFIDSNKTYRWTRDEQLERTLERGGPLGPPGSTYSYTDANYLLLTEIIEGITGSPFYTSMRELLKYGELELNDTWMPTLEEKPEGTKSLVHQYWDEMGWDSYDIDVSTDLYGGGGIACPPKDMARFYWSLFNGRIVQDTAVLNLIFTVVPTADAKSAHYYFGLSPYEIHGLAGYGHGGFWGTVAVYFPELNASIAVCTLERSMRMVRNALMDRVVAILLETTEDR
jgi:D-alanyl-D-alanine carboxypeptidase